MFKKRRIRLPLYDVEVSRFSKIPVHSFIHSLCGLSYDRSAASSKASSPLSAIWCFFIQFPVLHFLEVIH